VWKRKEEFGKMYKASESAAFSKEVALQFFIHQQATREKSLN
jgi:hypothetical protein